MGIIDDHTLSIEYFLWNEMGNNATTPTFINHLLEARMYLYLIQNYILKRN